MLPQTRSFAGQLAKPISLQGSGIGVADEEKAEGNQSFIRTHKCPQNEPLSF
jgi:hypothetical protein